MAREGVAAIKTSLEVRIIGVNHPEKEERENLARLLGESCVTYLGVAVPRSVGNVTLTRGF